MIYELFYLSSWRSSLLYERLRQRDASRWRSRSVSQDLPLVEKAATLGDAARTPTGKQATRSVLQRRRFVHFHKSDRIAIVHCGDLVQSSESLTKIGG